MKLTGCLALCLTLTVGWAQPGPVRRGPASRSGGTAPAPVRCDAPIVPLPGERPYAPARSTFKRATFFADGSTLKDPCGKPIILKGVNKMVFFDQTDPDGAISFREIAKTGANCVRITWQMRHDGTQQPTSLNCLDRILTNARRNKLIPVVGLWDFTNTNDGGFSHLPDYAAYWSRPDVVAVLKKHAPYLIVNIGNEAAKSADAGQGGGGDETNPADRDVYAAGYRQAVQTIRAAGLNVPLMIDGMDRGKSLMCFVDKGPDLLRADPQHNLIFSFHAYWPIRFTQNTTFIRDAFAAVTNKGMVIVVGELTKFGAWPGDSATSPCSSGGLTDYEQFATEANERGMGWLTWEWGPGNQWKTPGDCPEMDMTTDRTVASLNTLLPADRRFWAKELALDKPYSIQKTARKTAFILNGFQNCPK